MNVNGDWRFVIDSPMGKQEMTLSLQAEDGTLTGHGKSEDGLIDTDILDGSVDGDKLTWKMKIQKPARATFTFNVAAAGDELTGKVKAGMFGSFQTTGTKIS